MRLVNFATCLSPTFTQNPIQMFFLWQEFSKQITLHPNTLTSPLHTLSPFHAHPCTRTLAWALSRTHATQLSLTLTLTHSRLISLRHTHSHVHQLSLRNSHSHTPGHTHTRTRKTSLFHFIFPAMFWGFVPFAGILEPETFFCLIAKTGWFLLELPIKEVSLIGQKSN